MSTAAIRRPRIASVMVTYNPPAGLAQRIEAALRQTDFMVVCDNGSAQPPCLDELPGELRERISLLQQSRNIGIAAALNLGLTYAEKQGATQALLLDHDSTLADQMVTAMVQADPGNQGPVALRVPQIRYALPEIACRWPYTRPGQRFRFHFVYARSLSQPSCVDLAIGSGMLLDLAAWRQLGGFDEGLFIDLVDTEFCLRARQHGFSILAVPTAQLGHQLGEVRKNRLFGCIPVYPTHHTPLRHYYISRNRIILARRYARRFPSWLAYELLGALKLTLKVLCFERQRGRKLAAMLRGNLHGWRYTAPAPVGLTHAG